VGVGAIPSGEQRKFTFAVEVFAPEGAAEPILADKSPEPASR